MKTIHGTILTPGGFIEGHVVIDGDRLAQVEGRRLGRPAQHSQSHGQGHRASSAPDAEEVAARSAGELILPGFIDLHVHGGGGADTMEAGNAVPTLARLHARHGTTALLATTMTAPLPDIEAALRAMAPHCQQRPVGAARVLGVHLEGPYISPDRLGAQPAFHRTPSLQEVLDLHHLAPIRLVTVAPEVAGNLALIPQLVAAGMRVQIGHSAATYEQTVQALQGGASSFAHLFNAMSGLHHRAPGAVGAALAHAQQAEIIPDLLHVHPGAIRAALRAVPGLYAVTDATAAAGMPDGTYRLGRQLVHKCLGGVRLEDGTLAGSTLTMDQALRNLVEMGLGLAEASARVSHWPAQYLGLADRGRLEAGVWADLVVLDGRSLQVRRVIIEGEEVDLADAA